MSCVVYGLYLNKAVIFKKSLDSSGSAENSCIQRESRMISGEDRCVREAAHVYSPHFCPKSLPPVTSSSNGINHSFKQGNKQPRGFTTSGFTQQQAPSATLCYQPQQRGTRANMPLLQAVPGGVFPGAGDSPPGGGGRLLFKGRRQRESETLCDHLL